MSRLQVSPQMSTLKVRVMGFSLSSLLSSLFHLQQRSTHRQPAGACSHVGVFGGGGWWIRQMSYEIIETLRTEAGGGVTDAVWTWERNSLQSQVIHKHERRWSWSGLFISAGWREEPKHQNKHKKVFFLWRVSVDGLKFQTFKHKPS